MLLVYNDILFRGQKYWCHSYNREIYQYQIQIFQVTIHSSINCLCNQGMLIYKLVFFLMEIPFVSPNAYCLACTFLKYLHSTWCRQDMVTRIYVTTPLRVLHDDFPYILSIYWVSLYMIVCSIIFLLRAIHNHTVSCVVSTCEPSTRWRHHFRITDLFEENPPVRGRLTSRRTSDIQCRSHLGR